MESLNKICKENLPQLSELGETLLAIYKGSPKKDWEIFYARDLISKKDLNYKEMVVKEVTKKIIEGYFHSFIKKDFEKGFLIKAEFEDDRFEITKYTSIDSDGRYVDYHNFELRKTA